MKNTFKKDIETFKNSSIWATSEFINMFNFIVHYNSKLTTWISTFQKPSKSVFCTIQTDVAKLELEQVNFFFFCKFIECYILAI